MSLPELSAQLSKLREQVDNIAGIVEGTSAFMPQLTDRVKRLERSNQELTQKIEEQAKVLERLQHADRREGF